LYSTQHMVKEVYLFSFLNRSSGAFASRVCLLPAHPSPALQADCSLPCAAVFQRLYRPIRPIIHNDGARLAVILIPGARLRT
jgi:hypothetical protein